MASFPAIQLKCLTLFLLLAILYVPVSVSVAVETKIDSEDSMATEIEFLLDSSDKDFSTEDEFVNKFMAQEAILESKIKIEFSSDGEEEDELLTTSNLYDLKTTHGPISSAFHQILRKYAKLAPKVILSSKNSDIAEKYADVTEFHAEHPDVATVDVDMAEKDAVVAKTSSVGRISGSRERADVAERDSDVENFLTVKDVTMKGREEGSEGRQKVLNRKMHSWKGKN